MTPKGYYNVYTNGQEMAFTPPQSQQHVVSSEPLYTGAQMREFGMRVAANVNADWVRNGDEPTEADMQDIVDRVLKGE